MPKKIHEKPKHVLYKNIATFYAASRNEWRKWLQKNHTYEKSVWLILYKKQSDTPSVNYTEAVEEALCYGWIDSVANKRDEKSYYQYFAQRNPKSNWSKSNKERVEKLEAAGLITEAGYTMIQIAKENGTWDALDAVDNLIVPPDLEEQFQANTKAHHNWNGFSASARRGILEWISNAKRPETRNKRIAETVSLAAQNIKANMQKQ